MMSMYSDMMLSFKFKMGTPGMFIMVSDTTTSLDIVTTFCLFPLLCVFISLILDSLPKIRLAFP